MREVCKFLKKKANFQHILLFLNVFKQIFHISHVVKVKVNGYILKSKSCYNVKSSAYLCSYEDEDIGRFSILH